MINLKKIIDQNLFIIDSEKLETVKTRLIGFCINNGDIICDSESLNNFNKFSCGAFVYIHKVANTISIYQDFNGSFGLYLYRKEKQFVISNSFIYLSRYLSHNHNITLNYAYACNFITDNLCSTSIEDTIINEIKIVPKDCCITIDIKNKEINFENLYNDMYTVPLNSKDGIMLLDQWYCKWTKILENLIDKKFHISTDISGGFDSRMVLPLFLNNKIDFTNIEFYSIDDNLHCHSEDLKIASQIAKYYKFNLNRKIHKNDKINLSIDEILDLSFYIKLTFHKEMYFKYFINTETCFHFSGSGGECLRNYPHQTITQYEEKQRELVKSYPKKFEEFRINQLNESVNLIKNKYKLSNNDIKIASYIYKDTRCRNHYGKSCIEEYLSNTFNLQPLLDPLLYKLLVEYNDSNDPYLLPAIIYDRYAPNLLDFEFEGRRSVGELNIRIAKEINKKFKFNDLSCNSSTNIIESKTFKNDNNTSRCDSSKIFEKLKSFIKNPEIKNKIYKLFDKSVYHNVLMKISKTKFFPLSDTFSLISILYILDLIEKSKDKECSEFVLSNLTNEDSFNEIDDFNLIKFRTARIDIKNTGSKNNKFKILSVDDDSCVINWPNWFNKGDGEGAIFESHKKNMMIKIKIINDGILSITLRGIDFKDASNKRYPIYVEFNNFLINNNTIFDNKITVCHDNAYHHRQQVNNGEEICFYFSWNAINEQSLLNNNFK